MPCHPSPVRLRTPTSLLAALALAPLALAADDEAANDLHRAYGFQDLVVSKFNDGLFGLRAGDFDGDGHGDLAVVNNGRAKLELLLHRDDAEPSGTDAELVNALPDEAWFERAFLPTEERIWSLAAGDLDGDGRDELITMGDGGELRVHFLDGQAALARTLSVPIEDGQPRDDSLAVGDLDRDGLVDIAVLTKRGIELVLQQSDGSLRVDRRLPHGGELPHALELVDLDGDGFLDLLGVHHENEWALRLRRGHVGGRFGPELRIPAPELRSHALADLDGDGRSELLAVGRRSGRALSLRLGAAGDDAAELLGPPERVPFAAGNGERHVTLADLDRDGHVDVLVAEPKAARLVVYQGAPGGRLAGSRAWPSLLGASHPRVLDRDGDGLPEIVLAAPDEGAVALAEVDADGRVGFPRLLGAPGGELLCLDVDPADGAIWLAVGEGKGRRREHRLRRLLDDAEPVDVPLEDLEADPSDLLLFDLDRDGRRDVIVFVPTEPPRILLARDGEQPWQAVDPELPGLGLLEGVTRDALFTGDVDGDGLHELLVPAAGFARALALDAEGRPEVVAQVNLDDPAADVGAVAAADVDGDGAPEVVVVNRSAGRLEIYGLVDGAPVLRGRTELLGLSPARLLPADLDDDGAHDLLLVTDGALATCRAGGAGLAFEIAAEYESPVEDALLDRLAVGDVNGDGAPDVVLTETRKHLVHVAAVAGDALEHALKWPVFEARLFETSRRSSREPRELLVADVSGDGLQDIALIVHDRVLVYTQEPAR